VVAAVEVDRLASELVREHGVTVSVPRSMLRRLRKGAQRVELPAGGAASLHSPRSRQKPAGVGGLPRWPFGPCPEVVRGRTPRAPAPFAPGADEVEPEQRVPRQVSDPVWVGSASSACHSMLER
jgi:hypothetical protein